MNGSQRSAIEHFCSYGRAEGRQAFAFDEDWYVQTNADVQVALGDGSIASAQEHFVAHGRFEGRAPVPPEFPEKGRIFAFGAYGTNNVGDEAIFEGLKVEYPTVIQIFHHTATCESAIKVEAALAYKHLFKSDSRLIIGGGGLLYSQEAISDMIQLAQSARISGGTVHLLGLGCEGARSEFSDAIRQLIGLATAVTVRTSKSAEILHSITGKWFARQDDFAFNLKAELGRHQKTPRDLPIIGVVTGGDIRVSLSPLVSLIDSSLQGPKEQRARFVHIAHSRAYDDRYNNDLLVGEALLSDLSLSKLNATDLFRVEPFCIDPRKVLRTYTDLDGVMSERFHGLIFGHLANIPTLALTPFTQKNNSFLQDYPRSELFSSNNGSDLNRTYKKFIKQVGAQHALKTRSALDPGLTSSGNIDA